MHLIQLLGNIEPKTVNILFVTFVFFKNDIRQEHSKRLSGQRLNLERALSWFSVATLISYQNRTLILSLSSPNALSSASLSCIW